MARTLLFLAATLALLSPSSAASCLLEVGGQTYIDGTCEFSTWESGEGDFQIQAGDYFANVYPSSDPVIGYWNGTPEATHAHDPLGELKRDGACWSNDTAKVCAYK